MGLFNFNEEEILCFLAVLVRYSTLFVVLPFVGDRFVPGPVKALMSLAVTLCLFPVLVSTGQVRPADAVIWSSTVGGIVGTIALEVLFGLTLGFTAKLAFETISFGANLAGTFMGFAMANTYDPHQESQTQVVAEIQMALAMLVFLALDGHHLMLRSTLDSYHIVGLGKAGFGSLLSQRLTEISTQVMRFGIQIAAPIAISIFAVNVAFGVIAKAMPQLNILVLSFSVTAMVGLVVMLFSIPEFQGASVGVFERMFRDLEGVMLALREGS